MPAGAKGDPRGVGQTGCVSWVGGETGENDGLVALLDLELEDSCDQHQNRGQRLVIVVGGEAPAAETWISELDIYPVPARERCDDLAQRRIRKNETTGGPRERGVDVR